MPRAAAIVAVAAALLVAATPARAWVLSEDELEERSTELGLLGRAFILPMRPLYVVPGLQDPDRQVSGLFDLRLSFQHQNPWLKVVVHNQLTATIRSEAGGAGLLAMGRGVEPPRWLPLQWDLTTGDHFDLREQIDWLYASVTWGPATIIVGRQPCSSPRLPARSIRCSTSRTEWRYSSSFCWSSRLILGRKSWESASTASSTLLSPLCALSLNI